VEDLARIFVGFTLAGAVRLGERPYAVKRFSGDARTRGFGAFLEAYQNYGGEDQDDA
jgi:hypothetical protein